MNKNAELNMTIGMVIMGAVTVIVGLVLFQIVAQQVGGATSLTPAVNATFTMPSTDGGVIDLTGQELSSTPTPVVTWANATATVVPTTNYTIGEGVSTTSGLKSVQLTLIGTEYASDSVNITYTFGPDGYIDSSGGRSLAGLITLFFALGIAIVLLIPIMKQGLEKF